jgi:laminin, alpha 3/5
LEIHFKGQYCGECDSSSASKSFHARFAIDGSPRWWQSPPLSSSLEYNKVNLTIDFGQEFHVAFLIIRMANSPRPGVWALEKSVDYGKTFTAWQYFAESVDDCVKYFNVTYTKTIEREDQVICTTEYSKLIPVENGEVIDFIFVLYFFFFLIDFITSSFFL